MKKLNKFFAILVSLAMMATLCVSMAFAADYNKTDKAVTGGTAADPATGVLTKVLKASKGMTLEEVTFNFDFTQKKSAEDAEAGLETADAPITGRTIPFNSNSTVENSTDDTDIYTGTKAIYDFDEENVKTVNKTFPKAGRYQYTVVENQNAPADAGGYDYTLSKAEYLVTIDVFQDADGNRYVENIAVQETQDENGKKITEQNKDDPTPGSDDSDEDGNKPGDDDYDHSGDGSQFKFINYVTKKTDVTPDGTDDDMNGLAVEKQVKDNKGADVANDSSAAAKDFTFNVTVTAPEAAQKAGRTTYTAIIIDLDEEVSEGNSKTAQKATSITGATQNETTNVITFTSGTPATVTLKDGYRLVFKDIDIGAIYSVSETADNGYTATYATINGKDGENDKTGTVAAASLNVTEAKDYVQVTNTAKQSDKPTGILISNLPYIALALVAIGGLVAYVVVRRKADDEA